MFEIRKQDEEINNATLTERLGSAHMSQLNIGDMIGAVPSPESFKMYERILLRTWKKSQVRKQAQQFLSKTEEVTDEEAVESFLRELKSIEETGMQHVDFVLKEKLIEVYDQALNGVSNRGLHTGFHQYDMLTNGHGNGQLIIVAARPSVGKTAFAINMAMGHMDENAYGHLYSLEMSSEQFLNRMIAAKGRIDSQKMRYPKRRFDSNDWDRYSLSISELSEKHLYLCDQSSVKITEMYANTRKLIRQYPNKQHFIVVDYLQLLQPISNKGNRQEQVTEISRALKTIARDLNIPVIALSQLSRGVESRQNKRPTLADLRESGSLEQDADIVSFLYRDDYYDQETERKNIMEIIIAKQREGPVGTIELGFEKQHNLFVNLGEEAVANDYPASI